MRCNCRKLLFCLVAAMAACARNEAPEEVAYLPVRYVSVNLAEVASAETLEKRCREEEARFRAHLEEVETYEGAPTVENYYRSLDSLFASLSTVSNTSFALVNVHPDEALRAAAESCAQLLSKVLTDISLSRPIYDRVNSIDIAKADAATRHSLEKLSLAFRLSGIDKNGATRKRIRELNEEIVAIGQEFERNIREDVRYLKVDSVDGLAGLPKDYIAAHQPGEDGKIRISTRRPDVFPFFEYAESDELRKAMYMHFSNRGYPQNDSVLRQLIEARHELATLAGFDNFAELAIVDKMAGSPERVAAFLEELKGYTADTQDREYDVLLARLRKDSPDAERLELWQDRYIRSKVKKEQYEVDSRIVRQYFNYKASRDGIFSLAQDLFGVRFEPWETDTWHEDIEAWELYEDERLIGRFYLDMHPRDGKFQHAMAGPLVDGIAGEQSPVAVLICNFPPGNSPMQHAQVITFLHEFGHLLHLLFAGHHQWSNVSGMKVEFDFIEAPSQMLEEWVWDYDTISQFARNVDGQPIPRELHERMIAARDFGLGMETRRQLYFAALSLRLYLHDPGGIDINALSKKITSEYRKFEPIEGTHRYASVGHLNDYSAMSYTYQWSAAIATDMLTRFKAEGLRNVETAMSYREKVLARGGTRPAEELVTDFLGREISFEAYADWLRGDEER